MKFIDWFAGIGGFRRGKGLLANQERTGVYEEIYRPECGGGYN